MEILLEEKKKIMHSLVDRIEDNDSIDRFLALMELELIKIDKEPKRGLSGQEARKLSKEKVKEWWGK